MAFNEIITEIENICDRCSAREKLIDQLIVELGDEIEFNFLQPSKRVKIKHKDSPEIINPLFNETFVIKQEENGEIFQHLPTVSIKKSCDSYNPTPVSTKMNIRKNVLKDMGNIQTKNTGLKCRKILMDSFIKFPSLMPLVTMRRNIIFDDLDTDDEDAKGKYPEWSSYRRYRNKARVQAYVDMSLLEIAFSCPTIDVSRVFPFTSNIERNESSIWED